MTAPNPPDPIATLVETASRLNRVVYLFERMQRMMDKPTASDYGIPELEMMMWDIISKCRKAAGQDGA